MVEIETVLTRSSPVGLPVGASPFTVTTTVYSTVSPGARAPTFQVTTPEA